MKVLFIGKAADNPSTRYRLEPIAMYLHRAGHEVSVNYEPDFFAQVSLILKAGSTDLIFVQRKLLSSLVVRLLRSRVERLVFDFDDAVFLRSSGLISKSREAKFNAVIAASDRVFAGNQYLCDAATRRGAKVLLTPTCVDMDSYSSGVEKQSAFTLVWIGSSSTSRYLELLREELEEIGRSFPDIKLRVIADFEFSLNHLEVENVAWSQEVEASALMECHVGIAPMKDDDWTKGKCALKVIQYMAAGLPVISSDVGANREVIEDGATGYLISDRQDWLNAVARLRESEGLRRDMGENARQEAARHYSISTVAERVSTQLVELHNAD